MTDLPHNVLALMSGRVNTIEKLVMIVELGKRAGHRMTVTEMIVAVPFDLSGVRETLEELESALIIRVDDGTIELNSTDPDLTDLLRAYDTDPIGTVTTLSKISMNRIRSMAHAFADAFDLRKKR
jgi:hypothetical protein